MPSYDDLKRELESITELLERYPEQLQKAVFDLLMESYRGEPAKVDLPGPILDPNGGPETTRKASSGRKQASKKQYEQDKSLMLLGGDGKPSLKEFYAKKHPRTKPERVVVCVYYLKHSCGLNTVNMNQVYTCFRELELEVGNLQQAVWKASSNGYLALPGKGIELVSKGEDFVLRQLPKKKSQVAD